mgnify:CR=1 FL=1
MITSVKITEHLLLRSLILFFCIVIRSIFELYSCQLVHSCLPNNLCDEIEAHSATHHTHHFPIFKYSSALREAGIPALYDRRKKLSYDILKDIVCNKNHKLPSLSISLSLYLLSIYLSTRYFS